MTDFEIPKIDEVIQTKESHNEVEKYNENGAKEGGQSKVLYSKEELKEIILEAINKNQTRLKEVLSKLSFANSFEKKQNILTYCVEIITASVTDKIRIYGEKGSIVPVYPGMDQLVENTFLTYLSTSDPEKYTSLINRYSDLKREIIVLIEHSLTKDQQFNKELNELFEKMDSLESETHQALRYLISAVKRKVYEKKDQLYLKANKKALNRVILEVLNELKKLKKG